MKRIGPKRLQEYKSLVKKAYANNYEMALIGVKELEVLIENLQVVREERNKAVAVIQRQERERLKRWRGYLKTKDEGWVSG